MSKHDPKCDGFCTTDDDRQCCVMRKYVMRNQAIIPEFEIGSLTRKEIEKKISERSYEGLNYVIQDSDIVLDDPDSKTYKYYKLLCEKKK